MPVKNIVQLFLNAADEHSGKIAFVEGNSKITYAELLKKVQSTAAFFSQKDIGVDDKVLVFIPMKTDLYVTVLALLYIGACPVFLDEWVSVKRLKECLKTVPCKAIVAERKLLFLSWFISPLRRLKKLSPHGKAKALTIALPAEREPSDTALVTFTTGSTGTPKAANRTHHFLAAQQAALQPLLLNHFQTTLTLLPIVILLNLSLGKTNVLPQQKLNVLHFSTIKYAAHLIKEEAVESIIASPAITVAIAKFISEKSISTTVRQVITGGGPVFPDEAKMIIQAFPKANATVVYGSTEAEPISSIAMQQLARTSIQEMEANGLPVGESHQDIQVAIIPYIKTPAENKSTAKWTTQKLKAGHSGEIVVSGPHVLQAYLNNKAAQQQNKFLVDDVLWHRTGDEGMLDDLGNLYFRGRCTEVINYNSQVIYPVISTWLLKQKVRLSEAAILSLNNELLLIIEKQDKVLENKIIDALKGTVLEMATIRYLATIPKDKRHHTKIDYEKLRQLLS
jgi:olefin beta-lactone synthetase